MSFFTELEQIILKFVGPESPKQFGKRSITLSDFKLYYKVIVTKQHGTGTKPDTKIHKTESKVHK